MFICCGYIYIYIYIYISFIVFILQTLPGQYHYNPVFSPVDSDFLNLQTIIIKWLPCNTWFIQTEFCINVCSPEIEDILSWICIVVLNIIVYWQDSCLFLRKHEVIIVAIFQMHTSWQWFMIVHDNTSQLNILGELYCKGYFSLFLLLLWYVFVWLYCLMVAINTFSVELSWNELNAERHSRSDCFLIL